MKRMHFGTLCVHAGEHPDPVHGSHTTPIYQTSTFVFDSADQGASRFARGESGYTYARLVPNTPTHTVLGDKIAALEQGESAQTFASGMAAITAVALAVLKTGDHLLSTDVVYGCTYDLFACVLTRLGIEVSFADTTDLEAVRRSFKPNTRLVFLESPSNPTLNICDISAISKMARARDALTVVDNTFATPMFQVPLRLGADAVLHSCTKYLGGHADLIGGALVGSREFIDGLVPTINDTGMNMSPHEAWLCIRGLKTLHLRMDKHQSNAMLVSEFLTAHPKIAWVRYPGLASHPQHRLAQRQMKGFGGVVSFGVAGGISAGRRLIDNVELCSRAVSLGAVDTLIQHPASMTHAGIPEAVRRKSGITDDLVRLSVGIEDAEDIIEDLNRALQRV